MFFGHLLQPNHVFEACATQPSRGDPEPKHVELACLTLSHATTASRVNGKYGKY